MAEDNKSKLPDIVSGGKKLWDLWSGYNAANTMATAGASQGMLYPGGISGAVPPAFSGGTSALSTAPILGMASFVVPKILQGFLGDKPAVSFMAGDDAKFMARNDTPGRDAYDMGLETHEERDPPQWWQDGMKSEKYNYRINARETDQAPEVQKAMIEYFDNAFAQMEAQGVDVNAALESSDYAHRWRMDKDGFSPDAILQDVMKNVEAAPQTTIPQANDQTIPGGDLGNADPTIMGEGNMTDTASTDVSSGLGAKDTRTNEEIVTGLYKSVLGRDPDAEGLKYWADQLERGSLTEKSLESVLYDTANPAKEQSTEDIVKGLYESTLGREADAEGLEYWTKQIEDGALTPEGLEAALWDNENGSSANPEESVIQFYQDTFGREPGQEGLEYWMEQINNGASLGEVRAGISNSEEAMGGETSGSEEIIRQFYQDLFGHEPDAEGLEHWKGVLDSGASPGEVRAGMNEAGGGGTEEITPTDYQYDIDNPQIFKDYVNSFYDSALQEYQNQSEQYQKATDEYKDTSSRLLGDQQDMLAGLTGRLDGSVSDYRDETGGYLDRLLGAIDDTKSSNLPRVNRLAGGQEVSYIPGSLRAANNDDRTSELALFDRSKGVSDNLLSTQTGNAETIWDAGDTTVNTGLDEGRQVYSNDGVMAGAGNATLNYLDALKELVNTEQGRDKIEAARIAAEQGNQFNYDHLASQEEMAEPGMVDYFKGIGTMASGMSGLGSLLFGDKGSGGLLGFLGKG